MMAALLVAGIGILLAGLLAIGFGIPVKEFSFGNTLILVGAITACTGVVMLGLWTVVRELKIIARQFGAGHGPEALAPQDLAIAAQAPENNGFLFSRDRPAGETEASPAPPPWLDEAASRERVRSEPPLISEPAIEPAPPVKQKRNLLFSSSSRKERERAEARSPESTAADIAPAAPGVAPPIPDSAEAPHATFDDAWPKSERARGSDAPPPRRNAGRAPSTFAEAGATVADRHPPAAHEEPPPVTVLKSGVVDGMAYSLYSDGSIEAQMPEGMMRFASIDELRSHLDQRP